MSDRPARLRLAFVVQRYGPEIDGGAEYECRRVAEALLPHHDVEVLTTCARDYLTWRNVYRPGVETVNGVRVRRFVVDRPRRVRAFGRYADWLYATPHTFFDEVEWVRRQGPLAPSLVEWIRAHADDHDGFLFYTYLYLPTTLGLPLVAHKAVLVPTAHDERPIYLDLFRSLFRVPRGLIFQVEEERAFVEARFHTEHLPAAVIGAGIDPVADADAARFRRQHGLEGPYFLYVGRVDVEKGCRALVDDVPRLARAGGRAGHAGPHGHGRHEAPAPSGRPGPRLPARGREADAIAGTTALVMPSPHESFSFVILEAWSQGTPVLATARSPVLQGHVERSGAGLLFDQTPGDFGAAVGALARRRGARQDARGAGPRVRRRPLPLAAHHPPVPRLPRPQVFGGSAPE